MASASGGGSLFGRRRRCVGGPLDTLQRLLGARPSRRIWRTCAIQRRRRTTISPPAPDVRKRGGRKLVITPDGETHHARPRVDSALVKSLARAHSWQRLLESGECGSITELAAAEKINRSYLCRVLRLTLLAPEILEAILDGRQSEALTLPALMKGIPVKWEGQRARAKFVG